MNGKWLKYLLVSICVHVLIVSVADFETPPNKPLFAPTLAPMLRANLMASAAMTQPLTQGVSPASSDIQRKIFTAAHAVKKLAVAPPKKNTPGRENPAIRHAQTKAAMSGESGAASGRDDGKQTSTVIHKANYRRQIPPVYPRRALELGQEGTVTLHAEVIATGQLRKLKVAESSGHRLLDRAALVAVKKWEFEPADADGNTTTNWVRVPVRFVLR